MIARATVLKPAVATHRPASIGPCYYLCRSCHGSGEALTPKVEAVGGAHVKAVNIRPEASRFQAGRCPRCNGIGLELR